MILTSLLEIFTFEHAILEVRRFSDLACALILAVHEACPVAGNELVVAFAAGLLFDLMEVV